jgi:hypothetical protein
MNLHMYNESLCVDMMRYFARSPCCYFWCYNKLLYRKLHRLKVYHHRHYLNRTLNTGSISFASRVYRTIILQSPKLRIKTAWLSPEIVRSFMKTAKFGKITRSTHTNRTRIGPQNYFSYKKQTWCNKPRNMSS